MGDIQEEEEPEGKVVAGPIGEAIVHSPGNMLPVSLALIIIILYMFSFNHSITRWVSILTLLSFSSSPWSISCGDESESEEGAKVETKTKEEEELGILWSWMEVGGLLALDEVEAQKLLQEVGSLSLPDTYMACLLSCSFLFSVLHLYSHISFSRAGSAKKGEFPEGRGPVVRRGSSALGDGGLGKVEAAVAGLEVEGF